MIKIGKVGESKVSNGKRRLGIPRGAQYFLKLKGGETIEWLTATTDIPEEQLADDCLILKVKRGVKT